MEYPAVRPRTRRGSGALEAALVLPVLLVVLVGLIETGWLFMGQQVLNRAVREGCRTGAVSASPADLTGTAADAIEAALSDSGFTCPAGGCAPEVSLAYSAGERYLACRLTAPHAPLTSLIPGMDSIALTSATRNHVERTD
jgi:hypothetical protein